MHCLHPKNLVVALFVIEHRRCKIFKHIVVIQRTVGLVDI